jgi:hypothetical protein
MSRAALLNAYPDIRKKAEYHELGGGRVAIDTRQDCEPIVEFVAARRGLPQDHEMRYLGEMPLATVGQALVDGWLDDPKALRKWFRDNPKFWSEAKL